MRIRIPIALYTVILFIFLPVVSALGCNHQAEPAPTTVPPSPPSMAPSPEIPANYTTYTDDTNFFSISYPSDWEPALSLIADIEKEVKEVINDIKSGLPLEKVTVIFLAGQPMAGGIYNPNVNIAVEPILEGVSTLDQMVEAEVRGAKTIIQDYREYSRVKTTINGREATILDYEGTLPGIAKRRMLQMMTLVGETIWVVSCSSTYEDFATWEKDFHTIVRSLQISN